MYEEHELGAEADAGFKSKNGLRKRTLAADDDADKEDDHMSPVNGSGEGQALLGGKKEPVERLPRCYSLRRYFGCVVSREQRRLNIDGTCQPRGYPTNR